MLVVASIFAYEGRGQMERGAQHQNACEAASLRCRETEDTRQGQKDEGNRPVLAAAEPHHHPPPLQKEPTERHFHHAEGQVLGPRKAFVSGSLS